MANPEHVAIVKQGAKAIVAWRAARPEERLDLSSADLSGADLRCADLRYAFLIDANLRASSLRNAFLTGGNLRNADLSSAYLRDADLSDAFLSGANLSDAFLRRADLSGTFLIAADLSGADLSGARINRNTQFDGISVNGNTKGLGPWVFNPQKYILREIEFPPEYHQAGIGIMYYFATVLRQKYPAIPATVQITQEELTVRMTIETDDGHREIVEQTLEAYGLVAANKMAPESLLDNRLDVMELRHELDITRMRLEHARDRLELKTEQSQQLQTRVASLEEDMKRLQDTIVESFKQQQGNVRDSLRHAQRLNTRLVNTTSQYTSEFTQFFRELFARPDAQSDAVRKALVTMQTTLDAIAEREEVNDAERAALRDSVITLKEQSPSLLDQVVGAMQGVGSGIVANIFTAVLTQQGLMP